MRRVLWTLAAVTCVGLLLPGTPAQARAADASVSGRVTDVTKSVPVAGTEVRIVGYQDDTRASANATTTDKDGSFSFTGLQAAAGWTYEIDIDYLDARYYSDELALRPGENRSVELKVYQPTTSAASLVQDSWVVWIDVQGSRVAVEQDLVITNSATSSFVGGADLGDGRRAVVSLPLTSDADNFQYLGFLSDVTGFRRDTTFISTAPILPGQTQAALRYETQAPGEMVFPVAFPTTSFTLMAPDTVTIETTQLLAGGTSQDRGTSYRVYSGSNLKPGDSIRAVIKPDARGGQEGWNTKAVVAVGIAMIAVVMLAMLGRRRRSIAQVAARTGSPRTGPAPARPAPARPAPTDPTAPSRAHSARPDVDLMVDHVALLDLAYEQGVLSDEADYHRRRDALTAKLATTWDRAGEESTEPTEGER